MFDISIPIIAAIAPVEKLKKNEKNMLFWVALVLMAAISLFTMTMYIFQSKEWAIYGEELYFDSCYFVLSPFIGLFITVVIVFFLGVDYSDGTIRNKITSPKQHVFL